MALLEREQKHSFGLEDLRAHTMLPPLRSGMIDGTLELKLGKIDPSQLAICWQKEVRNKKKVSRNNGEEWDTVHCFSSK